VKRLWWATAVNSVGDGASAAAVPLLAVTVTRDPRLVSVVAAAAYLPWLLLSLPAGALVDRYDRVGLMWRAQAAQAVVAGVLALLALRGHAGVVTLAGAVFCLGACAVVCDNAAQAVLPSLVPKALLHRVNGRQSAAVTVGRQFVGPPVGGVLSGIAVGLPFVVDAVSFGLSAGLVAGLPRRPVPRAADGSGLRWLLRHRLLRTLALLLGVNTFCFQLGMVTLVLLATQALHLSTRGYGLLLAGAALGGVLGGLVNARVIARIGTLPALLGALTISAVAFAAIGASPDAFTLGALLAVNGFATTLWNIVTVSLRQDLVPAHLRGRVNSVYRMLGWGLMPLGAVAGGLVAHRYGLRAPFPVAAVLRGIALLAALPVLRSLGRP
jgi:MFS family permease